MFNGSASYYCVRQAARLIPGRGRTHGVATFACPAFLRGRASATPRKAPEGGDSDGGHDGQEYLERAADAGVVAELVPVHVPSTMSVIMMPIAVTSIGTGPVRNSTRAPRMTRKTMTVPSDEAAIRSERVRAPIVRVDAYWLLGTAGRVFK